MNIEVLYLEISPEQSPCLKWQEDLDITARSAARMRMNQLSLRSKGSRYGSSKKL